MRPVSLDSHPVTQLAYILPTASIDSTYDGVKKGIRHRLPGLMVIGQSRFGKTYGCRYIRIMLKEDYPKLVVFICTAETKDHPVESSFWENLLVSVGHPDPKSGSNSDKRRRLVAKIVADVVRSGLNHFVLFLDEAPRLEAIEYGWLWDLHDSLEHLHIRMITCLIGTEKLLQQKDSFRQGKEIALISRFMVGQINFHGVRDRSDAATCLQGYDEAVYPENTDWTYTRFFFPAAWSSGLRMAKASDLLWEAFAHAHREAGINISMEIPMVYFARAVEIIFGDYCHLDSEDFVLTKAIADQAVTDSMYVENMMDLALGLGDGD